MVVCPSFVVRVVSDSQIVQKVGKSVEAHLDWHFHCKQKLREENWTQMRSWYISEKDWIQLQEESELDAALSTAAAQRAKAAEQARNKKKKKNGRSNSNNMAQGPNFGTSGGTNPNGSNSNGGTSVKIPKLNLMKLNLSS